MAVSCPLIHSFFFFPFKLTFLFLSDVLSSVQEKKKKDSLALILQKQNIWVLLQEIITNGSLFTNICLSLFLLP